MADNVTITPGAGASVATDDVGGVHYQRVKLTDGTADSSTAIASGGGVEAGALRVTIASDSTGVVSVDDNGGTLTVDGTVAVTGTFWQATQPVSAASLPLPGGAATSALQGGGLPAALAANGGLKVEGVAGGVAVPVSGTVTASAQPGVDIGDVTINNASGAAAVNIQDGGNTITVDGTLAVTNADLTTIAGAVSGTHMQVDVLTAPSTPVTATDLDIRNLTAALDTVVVTGGTGQTADVKVTLDSEAVVLGAGSAAIGKLAANSGVDIGDVDVTSVPAPLNIIGNGAAASAIRVTLANDSTGTVAATLAAETTKVIGTVNISASQSVGLAAGNNNIGDVDVASIAAGDNNIGNVDVVTMPAVTGTCATIPVTLTVTNGAYSIADVVGGLITFSNAVSANGKSAVINTITLAGVTAVPYELWFFSADIATPRADNAVFGLAAADGAIFLGVVPILASDYFAAQTSFNNATIRGVGLQVKAGAATRHIYAYLKATATTSPGTTTLYLTVSFEQLD